MPIESQLEQENVALHQRIVELEAARSAQSAEESLAVQLFEQQVAERTEALSQANVRLEQALANAQLLHRVGVALIDFEKHEDAIQKSVDLLADALVIDRVVLIIFDTHQQQVTGFYAAGAGKAEVVRATYAELLDGLSGWVLRGLKPVLSPKGIPDPRESIAVQNRRKETNAGALIVTPLLYQGRCLGTLTAINRPDQRDFDEQDVELLASLANQLAGTTENNRLYLNMVAEVEERRRIQVELQQAYAATEQQVEERTAELRLTNKKLESEIVERRKAEDHLVRAQSVAHIGSWMIDIATNQLEWSQETYRIFGLPEGRPVFLDDFTAVIHPDDRTQVLDRRMAALAGAPYAIEYRLIVDGAVKWVREQAVVEFDAAGAAVRAVGTVQDITERRLAEVALRNSEEGYRAIFEGAKEGIIAVNLNRSGFAFVNPAICELFGYSQEEFLQLSVPDLHPIEAQPQILAEFSALVNGEKLQVSDIPCLRKDGGHFYADIKITNALISGDPHIVGFFHDVTDRYRSNALLQARLRLSTLPAASTLDHLLQTTLDEAEAVTESKIGYFHFLSDDETTVLMQHWSSNTLGERCTAEGKGHHYAITEAGVWADAVRTRQAMIYNNYANLPNRRELPEGHAPVQRLISAPVLRDGKVVALIGVGDKDTPYDQQDVEAVTILATETWDIVMRKRAEAARYESEERYRTLVESQDAVIAAIDAEGRHHFMNRIGAQLLNRAVEEIVGKRLHDLFPAQDADRQVGNIRQVIASEQGMIEEAADSWDGKTRWWRTNIQPLRDAEGRVIQALITAVDITERKEAELLLEERVKERTAEIESIRQRLELATRAAHIGIWDWNCKSDTMIWDDQMLRLYGITRADFDGTAKSWERGVHPVDLPRQWALAEAAIRNELKFDTEFRVVWPDGAERHLKANAITLFDEEGRAERMIGVNYDITLMKEAEQVLRRSEDTLRRANLELERAVRMKDDFLANMSHELRTPLTGILGLSEALQYAGYGDLNERQRRAVANIENSGRHLLELINDILDVSKIEADKLELQFEQAQLDDICQSSYQLIKGMAQKKRQNVRMTIDPISATIRCDARRLKQILVNLLSNAVKFTPEGGSLGLEVTGDDAAQIMRLTVWDSGIGIAPEELPRLFQPFVQLDNSLSRMQTGTGLGLALVARLTALHGGSVAVESTPGVGSRFTVSLPWPPEAPEPALPEPELREPAVQHTMTVEDNELDAARLTRLLKQAGIENTVFDSGTGIVERASALQPGVILLDINLPDRSGWDVLAELKTNEKTRSIPVVITSVEEDRAKAAAMGAAGSLVKPISPTELRAMLDRVQRHVPQVEAVLVIASDQTGPVVMVVDDNQINIDTLSDFLESNNYHVVPARSGWEFLERAPVAHPNLVLMDIQMPGMDGLEAIRRIRKHEDLALATVPIIALTALAMPGDRERCLAAGADEYLSKPMSLKGLLTLMEDLLQRV